MYLCFYRSVTSIPYSRSRTSRWHGYRVCDVTVTVEGPQHRLQEVQKALGGLKDLTTLTDSSYEDNDDVNTVHTNTYILIDSDSDTDTDSTQPLPNTTADITPPLQRKHTYILIDSDSDTDTDSTLPLPNDITNILTPPLKRKHDSDSDATPILTPLFTDCQRQIYNRRTCNLDTTPLVTPPFGTRSDTTQSDDTPLLTPPFQTSTDVQDSDTTPILTPPTTKTVTIVHRQRPKRLF